MAAARQMTAPPFGRNDKLIAWADSFNFMMESDVDKVCAIFPELERDIVLEDLNNTLSVEETVNRVLTGKFGMNQDKGDDSDDEELPDLSSMTHSTSTHVGSSYTVNTCSVAGNKVSQKHTISSVGSHTDVIDLSLECPADDAENSHSSQNTGGSNRIKDHSVSTNLLENMTDASWVKEIPVRYKPKDITCLDSNEDKGERKCGRRKVFYSSGSDQDEDCIIPVKTSLVLGATDTLLAEKLQQKQSKNQKDVTCISCDNEQLSEKDLKKQKRKHELEEKRKEKEIAKKMREEKREEMKRKKEGQEFEKMKKRKLQEASKNAKPGECMKFMTAVMDPGVLKGSYGTSILDNLQKQEVRFEIQAQIVPNIITLWRESTEVIEKEPGKLETATKEIIEDEILHFLPVSEFVSMVDNFKLAKQGMCSMAADSLRQFIQKTKTTLENRNITFIIHGLEKYFRDQATSGKRAFRNQVEGYGEHSSGKKNNLTVNISRLDVEEALLDVQLSIGSNFRFYENDTDIRKCVFQYIKAVAETIFKRNRQQTDFSLFMDSTKSVKVSKEGQGLSQVWRQQIQEFKNVSADMANAIMAEYPSPCALWQAYQRCSSEKEAELLLKDIVVRRGAGVLATNRKVGKEVSRRMYQIIACSDPNLLIK